MLLPMSDTIIELRSVSKSFGSLMALKNVELRVERGKFVTLLGPSGCGKTTLLRLLAGFDTPTSGEIFINGRSMASLPPEKRPVNTVFQSYALFPHMTVFDNVAFGPKLKGLGRKEMERQALEALEMVNLVDLADRRPNQLSGGQQQRVAIARAVVNKPLVLLLDEPLNALDYKLRKAMQIELKQLQRKLGITFIFVTHDQEEALSMSNQVVVMNHGCIEQVGEPREIYESPRNLFVARFVGEINVLDAEVLSSNGGGVLEVALEGRKMKLQKTSNGHKANGWKAFGPGDRVHVLVRPEDLRVYRREDIEPEDASDFFPATVEEAIYKGATVDLIVSLASGGRLSASQFFNEDDDQLEFYRGEQVFLDWVQGWEVVLPHES
ncbi:MAG: spermidine/putrescine ABC transporter ATP-binding protein PotA [Syntrophobacteraceae bacterium]